MGKKWHLIWRVWGWISRGHTLWELLQLAVTSKGIMGSLGGIGALIPAWLRGMPPISVLFIVLAGIGWGLFTSNQIAARRIQRIKQLPIQWIKELPTEDKQQLANRIYAREYFWDFSGITKTDPFLDVVFTLINAAVFPILIEGVDGRFLIEEEQCAQFAEFEGTRRVPHGESANLRIRQRLSREMVGLIMRQRELEGKVKIGLKSCRLLIRPEVPGEQLECIRISAGHDHAVEPTQE